jgi:hypothetical protein
VLFKLSELHELVFDTTLTTDYASLLIGAGASGMALCGQMIKRHERK